MKIPTLILIPLMVLSACGHVKDERRGEQGADDSSVEPQDAYQPERIPTYAEEDTHGGPTQAGDASSENRKEEEIVLPPCLPGMAWIPPGEFLYGPSKTPVYLDGYCLDLVEVTVGEWNACVADGGCEGMQEWEICTSKDPETSPNQCFDDRDDFPANYLNWRRAEAYCLWSGKRLPTSEEWEKGARGTDGRTYSWGEEELSCQLAHQGRGPVFNLCIDVDELPNRPIPNHFYEAGASPFGLLGTMGNVKEWVEFRDDTTSPPAPNTLGISRGADYGLGEWGVSTITVDSLLSVDLASQGHGVRCAASQLSAPQP